MKADPLRCRQRAAFGNGEGIIRHLIVCRYRIRQTLLLPAIQAVADGLDHSSEEIRERVRVQFDIAPHELLQKHKNGTPVFHNRVAWALAHLNMRRGPLGHSEAVEKVRKEVY